MVVLNEKLVLARSRAKDLSGVKNLNCWGANISDVAVLEKIPNVEVINFSANSIESLDQFAGCVYLRELYLRRNKLKSIDEVLHLKELKHLKLLWLTGNPFCEKISDENYRLSVLKILPHLHKLDDKTVTEDELVKALALTIDEGNSALSEDETKPNEVSQEIDQKSSTEINDVEEKIEETNSNHSSTIDEKPTDRTEIIETENHEEPSSSSIPTTIESPAPADSTSQDDDNPASPTDVELCKDEQHQDVKSNSEQKTDENASNLPMENVNDIEISSSQSDLTSSKCPASSSVEGKTFSNFPQETIHKSESGDAPQGTCSSAVQMTLDETNQLRVQLGLKPLSVAKYEMSSSPPRKIVVKKPKKMKKSTRDNLLAATLSLVAELDEESLLIVQAAVQEQLETSQQVDEEVFAVTNDDTVQPEHGSFQKKIVEMLEPG